MVSQLVLFSIAAYILGSVPFGKIIAKRVADIDITKQGSRNIGATNVARVLGVKWGIITLILDMLKGFVPLFLFSNVFPDGTPYREIGLVGTGLSALLGHQFPVFLRFRGGKGVATALGVYLAIAPFSCFASLIIFILVVFLWDMVSLGSMISMSTVPVFLFIFEESQALVVGSIIVAALICLKHKENIERLIKGEERKWSNRGTN